MWHNLFDRVYVVSLPRSQERRSYVQDHLRDRGVTRFEFHDACDADSPRVAEAFEAGRVMRYPPCFRCGQLSCGRDDCNNVLIPAQVATFITYLDLWRKIADRPQRALVLEDDVVLHDHADKVMAALAGWVERGELVFEATVPRLLRLGWALGPDHADDGPPRMSDTLRMSNPAHALTTAYAAALLDRFVRFDHTVDVFQHQKAPRTGEAVTILPPVASELSWSEGRFQSLIHPKQIHADYLERAGDREKAAEARRLAERHASEVAHVRRPRD